MPYNFVADGFHTKKLCTFFVADFLQANCDFTRKTAVLRFQIPLEGGGGLGTTYDVRLTLIGKRVVDFLLVLILLFLLLVTVEALRAKIY